MEFFAGMTEHVDAQVGRIVDEVDRLGYGDNTIIFYIWANNRSSAEGQAGAISELLAQNGIPTTIDTTHQGAERTRWLRCTRLAKTDNMYHAGWAWAGSTPYKSTKINRRAIWRHAQSDGGPLARKDQARSNASRAISACGTMSCPRFTTLSALRRRAS